MRKILRERRGTTLVEMLVSLLLMAIAVTMAAGVLHGAYKVYLRIQKMQYASSILDTAMTELRELTKDASGYVKIYANGINIADQTGTGEGTALEFLNNKGYVVLVTTEGCEDTDIYLTESQPSGSEKGVDTGRLLTRYYNRKTDRSYNYTLNGRPVARALAAVYGEGFYMDYYLRVTYRVPAGTNPGDKLTSLTAEVGLYQDADCTELVISDTESLDFRYQIKYSEDVTATAVMDTP